MIHVVLLAAVATKPFWPHLFSWPHWLDPVSWLWNSTKGYAYTSSIGIGVFFSLHFIHGLRQRNCSHHRCWRIRTWPHGHLRLCKVHHPHVPDHGRIGKDEIDKVTESQSTPRKADHTILTRRLP